MWRGKYISFGTSEDTPVHVDAAVALLQHEYHSASMGITSSRTGRVIIESVALQVFLLTMGLWSGPEQIVRQHSPDFWTVCDNLLQRLPKTLGESISMQNSILGMDVGIARLMTTIKQCFSRDYRPQERRRLLYTALEELSLWSRWIHMRHSDDVQALPRQDYYCNSISSDVVRLIILAASVLLEHLSKGPFSYLTLPRPDVSSWQMQHIIAILERRSKDTAWSSSYLGSWPVYTVGTFMRSPEHVELVRDDMRERWNALRMSHVKRYWDDLESIWEASSSETSKGIQSTC
jgi:hypothetical protein